ncbi:MULTISPECIES: flagellar export protein FliJ [Comamonas]|jgi:flagellar FliJ protein|uniref:flagellar export protein FliJ n=1 Tax=Comamonas TaxID=283 RepID=UPI00050F7516|nr:MULTISPECIES: flagellar export protein FliJ [Comamonas]KGG89309.1 flagellar export protein FliJ [Comamonas thiooxydans]KGH01234.1 flagellar export protein FliJ [Comamonas thiooxydans]MDH1253849.1 flagellar export protein FliJ [Comamonas thiooxydans]TZG09957.1 flagellar export protein FliJ [Comamonas thiooxydans]UNV91229.1 flagellar export protein FliJ [Comamonas sp. 7D-2evo1]
MSSLNALNVAIEAAERKRDAARTTMQERQRAQQAAQAQMDQLQGYVLEMQARWGAQEGLAVQPEVMHHQYQFMERLQHAIGLQTRVVADQDIRLETARQALLAAELRVTSLQKVVQARRRDVALAQMRREQKDTDERATMAFFRRSFGLQLQEA